MLQQAQASSNSQIRRWFWMVLIALVIRLAVAGFLYPEHLNPDRDYWKFAGETGRIARSLAEGKGFSSPFFAETGPTAWLTPVFPLLLAGVFKVFGVYTRASALVILGLDCLFSALTCIPVSLIARKSFGEKTALWSGWVWVFFPYSIFFAADFIWATTLSGLLFACLFLLVLHLQETSKISYWIGFGALAGFASLNDPIVMSVAPFLGAWCWWRRYRSGARWLLPGLAAVLAVTVTVSPWFIRNYQTFGKFIPFRGNLGFEFYCGNNVDSWHWDPPGYHPSDTEQEWKEYQQLGEMGYMARKRAQAFAFIGSHRQLYATMTLRRVIYMWTGFWSFGERYLKEEPFDYANIFFCTGLTVMMLLGLRQAFRDGTGPPAPYIIVFLFFPLVYYVTHPEDYYRRPIDPLFVVLGVYGALSLRKPDHRGTESQRKA
jgi:4-amino-4-deoxy-L-arabinose transferase-like glycosyltransferase